MLLRAAVVAAVALAAAGCGGGKQAPKSSLPPGCEVAVVQSVVEGFLAAVTAGDRAGIARRLAPASGFGGLAYVEPDRTFETRSRAQAIRFLLARHRADEHLRILQLLVGKGIDANHVAIQFTLSRVASDLPARGIRTHSASGNGTVDCVSRAVSRWRLVAAAG